MPSPHHDAKRVLPDVLFLIFTRKMNFNLQGEALPPLALRSFVI